MRYTQLILTLMLPFFSCSKKNQEFKIKTVTINDYQGGKYPQELLHIRFLDGADSQHVLGMTAGYPAWLPLPAVLSVEPAFHIQLYKHPCYVQLWGDSTGLIGSYKMNMDKYKIIFPLEMEAKGTGMDVTLNGSWGQ